MAFLSRFAASPTDRVQAYEKTFEDVLARLAFMGFGARELARTWCYFRDVLIEYPAFNDVRRQAFTRYGLIPGPLPASTGIQGILDSGQHLSMDALAFSGPDVNQSIVLNPAQCEAPEYGSLFSRAVRIAGVGPVQCIVSGMASIGEDGKSLFIGDPEAQVDDTLKRAGLLLESCGMGWNNVVSGTAFLHPDHVERLQRKLPATVLGNVPLAWAVADVCRPELLFEIELMAFGDSPV
jgi:enamine deaminase RidA (YjgF/YER057c/UK114 family)